MKVHWILWTGLVICGACSLSRPRHTQSRYETRWETQAMLSQRDTHRDTLIHRSGQSVRHVQEIAVFKPMGTIAYHPDSGFRGAVSEVRIYRARTEMLDSLYHAQGSGTDEHTQRQTHAGYAETAFHSETRMPRQTPGPVWWIALAVAVGVCLGLLRWLRRRWF